MYDVVVRGGRVVNAAGQGDADVAVEEGRIVQIGGAMQGRREIDATGCLVLPGGVDPHTHLTPPPAPDGGPTWVDDFASGTRAAVAGGITTIGSMVFGRYPHLPETLAGVEAQVRSQAVADVFLHPVVADPAEDGPAVAGQLADAGYRTLKMFMVSPSFDRAGGAVVETMRAAAARGMLVLLHPEDNTIVEAAGRALMAAGRGDLRHYGESRPIEAEIIAVERACALAQASGAPVYLVHVSSGVAVAAAARARAAGVPVYVETRPLYLHLSAERMLEPDGPKYVGEPPLRAATEVEAMWRAVAAGDVHTLGSDHAPWDLAAKLDPALNVENLRPGVANLEWELPMLYSEGVRAGRISLERMVEVMSTNAAKLFGLYPRKGAVAVGADADLVVFDPQARRVVGPPYFTRAGYSVFDGFEVTGWPRLTLVGGRVAFEEGRVTAEAGSGRIVRTADHRPL